MASRMTTLVFVMGEINDAKVLGEIRRDAEESDMFPKDVFWETGAKFVWPE